MLHKQRQLLSQGARFVTRTLASVANIKPVTNVELSSCVRKCRVQFGQQFYRELRARNDVRYLGANFDKNPNGIEYETEVFDNKLLVGNGTATVVMLTGTPGHFTHFNLLADVLSSVGVRVISPNYPNESLSLQTQLYRHTPEERGEWLKCLLQELDVDEVDMLVAHSSGAPITTQIFKDSCAPNIGALALLNPVGADLVASMSPLWLARFFMRTWKRDSTRRVMQTVGPTIMNLYQNPFRTSPFEEVISAICANLHANNENIRKDMQSIAASDVPMLILCADNDRVMTKSINRRMVSDFGFNFEEAIIYGKDGKLEVDQFRNDNRLLVRTRLGGHFAFRKYSGIVDQYVLQLLETSLARRESLLREKLALAL